MGKKKRGEETRRGVRATIEGKTEFWMPSCHMESLEISRRKHIRAVGCVIPGITGILEAFVVGEGTLQLSDSGC